MTENRMITFVLGRYRFAVPIDDVREVIQVGPVVAVPGGRQPLEGILPYRDNMVLPLFSLLGLLGQEHVERNNLVVVAGTGEAPVGFRVRQMGGVMAGGTEDEVMPYEGELGAGSKAVTGVWRKPGGEHLLLDLREVFSS